MRRDWIRLYVNVPNDPKVQRLSAPLFRFWINCLCLAGETDGVVPNADDLVWRLRVDRRQVVKWLEELVALHLFDAVEGQIKPHNWDGRQYVSDISNERVKKYRQNKRNVTGNAAATPSDTEADTEADTEQSRAEQAAALLDKHAPRIIENPFGRPEKNPLRLKVEDSLHKARSRIQEATDPAAYELRIVTDELKNAGLL